MPEAKYPAKYPYLSSWLYIPEHCGGAQSTTILRLNREFHPQYPVRGSSSKDDTGVHADPFFNSLIDFLSHVRVGSE
jgi:hypothetical protein